MLAARNRGLLLAAAGIVMLLAATFAAYRLPAPLGADAPAAQFSARRAAAILQDLVGDGVPHPMGSPAAARLREAIAARLTALGYATEFQSGLVCNDSGVCGNPINIVARLAGSAGEQNAVLLSAHYDSVPAGPGASDDGAGVASVLEIARNLKALPAPRHPIILLITDGEEAGLLGALLFVHGHPLSKVVKAAVNLDARGTSGPSLMFETGTANSWLMRLYRSAIARPMTNSLYYVVYRHLPNDTDFTVFKTANYQGFNFAFVGDVGRYHTPLDSVAHADLRTIQHQGAGGLAMLRALAMSPVLEAPAEESVFFDAYAQTLIVWRAEFTLPVALLSLFLLLAETAILWRGGLVAAHEILWGGIGGIGALLSGALLSIALLAFLIAVHKVPPMDGPSWISQPLPMNVAAAAIAVLTAAGASHWLALRARFWGFWTAAALLLSLLGIANAVYVPGASYIFLLTALAAGLAALPCALCVLASRPCKAWALDFAALLPALTLFGCLFPLLRFLYMSLGSVAWPLSTLVLSLASATLLPLLAVGGPRARRTVIGAAALVTAGGFVSTLFLPVYSSVWPESVNLEYWLNADTGQANYLARCDSLLLPPTLAAAAQFDPIPRPRFAGTTAEAFYAAAPRHALAAPELQVTSLPSGHFELQLRSARAAPEIYMVFPAAAKVAEVSVMTAMGAARAKTYQLHGGGTLLDLIGLVDGAKVSFIAATDQPAVVQVFDQSYGLADGGLLQRARTADATSSQDGDVTVVHRTVSLNPAADRPDGNH
jgi:Peptidase family M28